MIMPRVGVFRAFSVVWATVAIGLAAAIPGAPDPTKAAAPTAQELILGAIKNQGQNPGFRSGYVEMLHQHRTLNIDKKRAEVRGELLTAVKEDLERARKSGKSAEEVERLRRDLEIELDKNVEDIVQQLAGKVTYERCLFLGNRPPGLSDDNKTRIDRIEVASLDVSLSDIPKRGRGVVVTEGMGTPQGVCAGYSYGRWAKQAYLQTNESFPRFQDFGRIYGNWSVAFTLNLMMNDPQALKVTSTGKKVREWRLRTDAKRLGGHQFRTIGEETRESSPVYVVEVSAGGRLPADMLFCKAWVAPKRGFIVPRLELYRPGIAQSSGLSPRAKLTEVMECSGFVYLKGPDVWFPLLTKYTKYDADGSPETVDTYKVFSPKYVSFNEKIDEDEFKIAFKRGMRLEDGRRPGQGKYYGDGLKADLFVLPSELAALVDRGDPAIAGGPTPSQSRGARSWLVPILVGCAAIAAVAAILARKRPRA